MPGQFLTVGMMEEQARRTLEDLGVKVVKLSLVHHPTQSGLVLSVQNETRGACVEMADHSLAMSLEDFSVRYLEPALHKCHELLTESR